MKIDSVILVLAFCLLLGPLVLSINLHYPDEVFYRDAAVVMIQDGDYLTPKLGNGELRFNKPILTYWAVLSGFKLFGITDFGSRIFFLLAGAATVWLTFRIGMTLFSDKKIAGVSAIIIASNPLLILASGRSIPDVLLVLTMTLCAAGLAGFLRYGDDADKKYTWFFYMGMALAFQVKGLPAVALGGLGFLYILLNPWKKTSWKTLINIPAILVGLLIGSFWFVAMWKIHGPASFGGFMEDQVGIRVASKLQVGLRHGLLAVLLLFVVFLPWSALLLSRKRKVLKSTWNENPQFFCFVVLWGVAICGMGAMTIKFYERYLLPVAPVIAVWTGWLIVRGMYEINRKWFGVAAGVVFAIAALLLTATFWINSVGHFQILLWIFMVLGLAVLIYLGSLLRDSSRYPTVIGYSFLLIYCLLATFIFHISLPHQGQQVVKFVAENTSFQPGESIAFAGNPSAGSKIRMSLAQEYRVVDIDPGDLQSDKIHLYRHLFVEDRLLPKIDTSNYEVSVAAQNWLSRSIPDLLLAYGRPEFESILSQNSKRYFLLSRRELL